MRRFHIIMFLLGLAGLVVIYLVTQAEYMPYNQAVERERASDRRTVEGIAGIDIDQPFTLINHKGETVTHETYAGEYRLIYFGFTYCPDICPMELTTLSEALNILGEAQSEAIRPIFISVDPERDTPEQMARYVEFFHPRMVGWTGSEEQIEAIKRIFRVYARKVQTEEMTDYTVDHSSFVYLVSPDNRLLIVFRMGTPADEMAALLSEAVIVE